MPTVRIVTATTLPEPDPDEALLVSALAGRGLDATLVAWDDPAASWSGGLSVIRSTWNYHRQRERFVAWAERAGAEGTLLNPADVVRWNTHKSYLLDLQHAGIPTVPTALVHARDEATLRSVAGARGWRRVVVKPAVSAGSYATLRFDLADEDTAEEAEAHLRSLLAAEDALVQPYLESVEGYGERALVWIDGELTHAVRKSPRFGDDDEEVSHALPIADDERRVAEAALARAPKGLLYGRVDLARGSEGTPAIMELELVEPSLFLAQHPEALARLVDAIDLLARGARV